MELEKSGMEGEVTWMDVTLPAYFMADDHDESDGRFWHYLYRIDADATLWTITKEWKHRRGTPSDHVAFSLERGTMTEGQMRAWIAPSGIYPGCEPTTAEHFDRALAELKAFVARTIA